MKLSAIRKIRQSGNRIYIRPLQESDFYAWKTAQDTMLPPQNKFDIPSARPKAKRNKTAFGKILKWNQATLCKGTDCFCGVFLTKTGQFIGRVGLMNIVRDAYQTSEITYRIHNRFWGQGYAKEAVMACLKLAFTKLKLNRIEAYIEPTNTVSIKVAESTGFKKEGMARKKLFTRKAWRDIWVYAAVCADYGYKFHPPIE